MAQIDGNDEWFWQLKAYRSFDGETPYYHNGTYLYTHKNHAICAMIEGIGSDTTIRWDTNLPNQGESRVFCGEHGMSFCFELVRIHSSDLFNQKPTHDQLFRMDGNPNFELTRLAKEE